MSDILALVPSPDSCSVVVTKEFIGRMNASGVPVDAFKQPPAGTTFTEYKILQGEHAWHLHTDPSNNWAKCRFLRKGQAQDLWIGTQWIKIGWPARVLKAREVNTHVTDSLQLQPPQGAPPWEQFVWHFWIAVAQRATELRHLGLDPPRIDNLLGSAALVAQNTQQIINCFRPAVRRVLDRQNYTIPQIIEQFSPASRARNGHAVLYLRVYTHQNSLGVNRAGVPLNTVDAAAMYVGRTTAIINREANHMDALDYNQTSWHYRMARRSRNAGNHIHSFVIADCNNCSDDQLAMAEETALQLFGTEAKFMLMDVEAKRVGLEGLRTLFMRDLANSASILSGYRPLNVMGCNATSPFFESERGRHWMRIRTFATPDRAPTTILKTAITLRPLGKTKQYGCHLSNNLDLTIAQDAVRVGKLSGQRAFLCLEVTEDGSRHPHAWYQASEIGLFKNNQMVSRLAIRLEYLEEADGNVQWYSIWLTQNAVSGNDPATGQKPRAWIKAFKITMLTLGWTLNKTSEWFPETRYPIGELQESVYDHEKLSIDTRIVRAPNVRVALPQLESYENNALKAERLFPDGPKHHWGAKPNIAFRAGSADYGRTKCHPCFLYGRPKDRNRAGGGYGKCETGPSNPYACTKCIVKYNRPCLWMYPEDHDKLSLVEKRRLLDEGEDFEHVALPCHAPAGGQELLESLESANERLDAELGNNIEDA